MKQFALTTGLIVAMLFGASSVCLFAQKEETSILLPPPNASEFRLGVSVGLTQNIHKHAIRRIDGYSSPIFLSSDYTIGMSSGLIMQYALNETVGLISHVQYSTRPGSLTSMSLAQVIEPRSDSSDLMIIDQSVKTRQDITYSLWELGLMGMVDLVSTESIDAGLALGGAVAYVKTGTVNYEQELPAWVNGRFLNDQNAPTRDNGRVLVLVRGQIPNTASTRFSLRGGAFVDIGIFKPVHITPGVYYDYGLTSVRKDSDWTLNSLLFQLDLTMEL